MKSLELTDCAQQFDQWMSHHPTAPKEPGMGLQIDCWNAWRKGWLDKLAGRRAMGAFGYVGYEAVAYRRGRCLALTPAAYRPRDNGRFVPADGYSPS